MAFLLEQADYIDVQPILKSRKSQGQCTCHLGAQDTCPMLVVVLYSVEIAGEASPKVAHAALLDIIPSTFSYDKNYIPFKAIFSSMLND